MSARRACRRMLRTDIAQQHSIVRQHRQGSLGAPTCDMPAMLLSFACVDCRPLLARLTSPQPAPGQARACARLGQPLRRVHQDAFSPPVSGQPPPQPASHNQCSRTPAETHAWKMATRMQQWSAGGTEQGGLHLLFFGALKLGQRLSRQIDKLGHCLFRQTICRAEGQLLLGTRALVVTRSPAQRAQRAPNLSVLTVPAPTTPLLAKAATFSVLTVCVPTTVLRAKAAHLSVLTSPAPTTVLCVKGATLSVLTVCSPTTALSLHRRTSSHAALAIRDSVKHQQSQR